MCCSYIANQKDTELSQLDVAIVSAEIFTKTGKNDLGLLTLLGVIDDRCDFLKFYASKYLLWFQALDIIIKSFHSAEWEYIYLVFQLLF